MTVELLSWCSCSEDKDAFVKWLEENYKYDIKHIMRISSYNSRSNTSIKATHHPYARILYSGRKDIHRNIPHLHGPRSRTPASI